MSFRPILDRVLIRRLTRDNPDSVIAIPEQYRQDSPYGTVVALGDGVVLGSEYKPLTNFVHVGDVVKFSEYSAEKIEVDGEELALVRIHDVRGVEYGS